MAPIVVAVGLVVLAVAHSLLGERALLRPLFAQKWSIGIPRWAAQRILRFAWHLTSMAWLALGALALGLPVWATVGALALSSGLVIVVVLPGHLAWPIFGAVGLAAGLAGGFVDEAVLQALALVGATCIAGAGLVHLYWALGGRRGFADALPTGRNGAPLFMPGPWLTAAVGLVLLTVAGFMGARVFGLAPGTMTLVIGGATLAFGLRSIGDGRSVGLSKRRRQSRFARRDDRVYTPLSVLFTFGGVAALLL